MHIVDTRRGMLTVTAPIDPSQPAEGDNLYTARYSATPPGGMSLDDYTAMIEREVGIMCAYLLAEKQAEAIY